MPRFKIKREELDYILTDCSPEEISEIFSYIHFYNYLCSKTNIKKLDSIYNEMSVKKSQFSNSIDNKWSSKPLDFYTIKNDKMLRELSLLQPIAILNIYFLIRLYGNSFIKELANPIFSIRYHTKSNNLYYKGIEKDNFFSYVGPKIDKLNRRRIVEQTGSFFNIVKFKSILDFGSSELWEKQCIKFNYFCKLDYKNCFPSIYSHSFNWIVTNSIIDSMNLKCKPNLFSELDRTLQNINGKITNGIVVGPEFARMSAELLLQHIDKNVESRLKNNDLILGKDYSAFRFVDDIYIFGKSKEICDIVINCFSLESNKFKLAINQLKIIKDESPLTFSDYQVELNQILNEINNIFAKQEEINCDTSYLTITLDKIYRIRRVFDTLVHNDYSKAKIYSAFILSTILNKFYEKQIERKYFASRINNSLKTEFLGMLFHFYAPYISFKETQKIVAIISMLGDEIRDDRFYGLQKCLNMYSNYFRKSNTNDYINLFLVLRNFKVYFPSSVEESVLSTLKEEDNPVNLATFLIYSRYNNEFYNEVIDYINKRVESAIDEIIKDNDPLMYKQFWFVIIFNKCPFINHLVQSKIDNFLNEYLAKLSSTSSAVQANKLIVEFMLNNNQQFIEWNPGLKKIGNQIIFRTHYKTVFRKKKRYKRLLSAS